MSDVLLQTKLYVPQVRPSLVSRPHLIEKLNNGLHKLTLVTAPAGFGKSTLVAEWGMGFAVDLSLQEPIRNLHLAWLSLEDTDNDPVRFLSYVIAALQTALPEVGQTAVTLLQSPQPPALEAILALLINELVTAPMTIILVLDDYHTITTLAIHQAVTFLIEHQPPTLHLVITSRADPMLPLARWRARRELTELRVADLRFTAEEAAVFLNDVMKLKLTAADVVALEARTEGWIAGLQLVALALQGYGQQPDTKDAARFIQTFTGSHRYIVSYLVEEVLNRRPQGTMEFLLQTSILDPLSGSLCDYVLGKTSVATSTDGGADDNSQSILEKLEHANLFITPLDEEGKWYRYHHLFAEVLYARLQKSHPERVRELHLRASEWYEQSSLIPEAVRHALAAKAWEQAGQLIERNALSFGFKGQIHLVLSWLTALPEYVIRSHPLLCIFHAGALMHSNHLEAAEARLQDAERTVQSESSAEQARHILGRVAMQRSNLVRIQGDIHGSLEHARQALNLLPETDTAARASAGLNLAYHFLVSGKVNLDNERLLTSALAPVQSAGNAVAALRGTILLARLSALQGRLYRAGERYQEASKTLAGQDGASLFIGTPAYFFGLGDLLREWNSLDESESLLTQGVSQAQRQIFDADVMMQGYQSLARLRQARGDSEEARTVLLGFIQLAEKHHFSAGLLLNARAVQAWLDLQANDISAAVQWAKTRGIQAGDEFTFPQEREYLTLARLFIGMGQGNSKDDRLSQALHLLERLREAAQVDGRIGSLIEILCLLALTFQVVGDPDQAQKSLTQAITLAGPEGYIRTFLDEGEPLRRLLAQTWSSQKQRPVYVEMLLAAFQAEGSLIQPPDNEKITLAIGPVEHITLLETLNQRESEILSFIAQGLSNREIAERLVLAPSTVKWYINHLYSKLGAKSRTHALVRARELGLL